MTPSITTLRIGSSGGDIHLGMDMGDWVYKNGLNVEVLDVCFSSCANYIFPAGKAKILGKNSMLGWHGGATQYPTVELVEQLLAFKTEQLMEVLDSLTRGVIRETQFFNKISVRQELTVYGQQRQYDNNKGCVGWSYSLESMKIFAIQGVVLKSGDWAPPTQYKGKCINTITDAFLAAPH